MNYEIMYRFKSLCSSLENPFKSVLYSKKFFQKKTKSTTFGCPSSLE